MMLIAVTHAFVLAELLIGFVIGIDSITASSIKPRFSGFDTEVVIFVKSQPTLTVGTLDDALRQCNRGRDAVPDHLLDCGFLVLVYVLLVL